MFTGLTGYRTYIAATGVVLAAISCMIQHYTAGDLAMHWTDCVQGIGMGAGLAGLRSALATPPK